MVWDKAKQKIEKRPLVKWKNEPLPNTPDEIREVFAHRPDWTVVGRRTGKDHGIIVIDIDPRHGGDAWFTAGCDRIPLTRIHVTPTDGAHLLFQGVEVRNSAGKIAPGVDVRGEDGIFVDYSLSGYPVQNADVIAPCPEWLLELARKGGGRTEGGKLNAATATRGSSLLGDMADSPPPWSEALEARIRSALAAIPGTISREDWLNIGRALNWASDGEGWDE
jgi:hypothetical protein